MDYLLPVNDVNILIEDPSCLLILKISQTDELTEVCLQLKLKGIAKEKKVLV